MNNKTILCVVTCALTSCATQRKTTSTTHNIKQKDSTHVDQIAILHRHDTLWLTRNETKNGEKQEFSTEIRQNTPQTSTFITKIITIETLIIAITLLIYLIKKRQKR